MASSLPAKIFQGKETHRIINTQAARIGIILYKKKKGSREVKNVFWWSFSLFIQVNCTFNVFKLPQGN